MSTPVTMELIHHDLTVPPPDNLIAGNYGALYTDTVKLTAAGEYKRGMLMMSGNDGYVSSTKAGVSTAGSLCILTDDVRSVRMNTQTQLHILRENSTMSV